MTTYYLRSTTGSDVNTGADWNNAFATLAHFYSLESPGDICYVSQAHAESTVGSVSFPNSGTPGAPTQVICVNDGAAPPTALATSGTITNTGASVSIVFSGSFYFYGLTFTAATSGNCTMPMGQVNVWQIFDNCKFRTGPGTTGGSVAAVGAGTAGGIVEWRDCTVRFTNAAQVLTANNHFFHWNGGGLESGGTTPTNLISYTSGGASAHGVRMLVENCDFSAGGSTMNLATGQFVYGAVQLTYRNCLLPSSWSGNFCSAFTGSNLGRVEVFNCRDTSGGINHRMKIIDACGNIDVETTLVKSGGATDGTTQLSWKMASTSLVAYPATAFYSPEVMIWNGTTGSALTIGFDVLHDSATALTNAEVWIEANYAGSSSSPVETWVTSRVDPLTAATSVASSSVTWVTTGMSNPNKQRVTATFTPQAIGWLKLRLVLAKTSKTIYVDPLPTGLSNTMPAETLVAAGNTAMGQFIGGQYMIRTQPFQFQAPGGAYIISGVLSGSAAQVAARYFLAC